jgi:two-component system CheB/CheR fusion protein
LSAVLRSRMRARDTAARLGGDEFGLLLEHCTAGRGARIGNNIRKAISRHTFVCNGRPHRVGVSVGIVPLLGQGSPGEALRSADSACYSAKREGGNQVQLDPSAEGPTSRREDHFSPASRQIIRAAVLWIIG